MDKVINSFNGEYRFLSNFWLASITYEGITYPSAEHAYQAAKSNNRDIRQAISEMKYAREVKKLGQRIPLPKNWNDIRLGIMRDIVTAKFDQNPDLMKLLQETKNYELIEGNNWGDTFWGQSPIGNGRNELGKILMSVRDDITKLF